jgi:hypothetical protein
VNFSLAMKALRQPTRAFATRVVFLEVRPGCSSLECQSMFEGSRRTF